MPYNAPELAEYSARSSATGWEKRTDNQDLNKRYAKILEFIADRHYPMAQQEAVKLLPSG